jgi:hypothetical protein
MGIRPNPGSSKTDANDRRKIAERNGMRLVIMPQARPGTGDVITDPATGRLISGVEVEPFVQWPDDRGSFGELFRFGQKGIARDFNLPQSDQIPVSSIRPVNPPSTVEVPA